MRRKQKFVLANDFEYSKRMAMHSIAKPLFALSLLVLAACGSSSEPVKAPTKDETKTDKPADTEKPATTASKGARGLDAPDNDPALVSLAREAMKCFRQAECEAQGKWYEPFHRGQQVDFKTLVNLLEDSHPEVRTMAAGVLRGQKGKPGFHTDAAYATRVLDALEKEEDEYVARDIAVAAGFIDVKATGLEERVLKILRLDMRERVRVALTETILTNNWDNPTMTSAVKGMTSDASSDVRVAAIRAFDVLELRKEACPFWASVLTDRDTFLIDKGFYYLVSGSCTAQYEEMLSIAEKRPPAAPEIFQTFCRNVDPKDPFTKRFIDDIEKWVTTTTLSGMQRNQSLKLLLECDPVRAKKIAATLLKDQDEGVRERATEIDKMKIKKP